MPKEPQHLLSITKVALQVTSLLNEAKTLEPKENFGFKICYKIFVFKNFQMELNWSLIILYVGWNGILAEQEGRRYHDQTVAVPPPKQAMYT